jgi:hypothetical protein
LDLPCEFKLISRVMERLKIPSDLFEIKVRGSYLRRRFTYLKVGDRFTLTRSDRCLFLSSIHYLPRYKVGVICGESMGPTPLQANICINLFTWISEAIDPT